MRIEELMNAQAANLANVLDILGKLEIGDVIKAKVLEMTTGELMLKLFDGSVFKAQTLKEIDTKPGEMINFKVIDKNDGKVFLEVAQNNEKITATVQNDIKKALSEMNINEDPQNMAIAKEFKTAGIKMTADLFSKAIALANSIDGITPEKAVFLSTKSINPKDGIPDTLFKLLEGKLKIGNQLAQLQSKLGELSLDSLQNAEVIVSTETERNSAGSDHGINKDIETSKQHAQAKPNVEIKPNVIAESEAHLKSTADLKTVTNADLKIATNADIKTATNADIKTATNADIKTATNADLKTATNVKSGDLIEDAKSVINEDAKSVTNNESIEKIPTKNGEPNINERFHKINDSLNDIFVKIDSDNLKTDIEAKKLYKDILKKLDTLKDFVQSYNIQGNEDITARISGIQDGISFLNQLNASMTYVQIPINMSGFNTTGELYVMSRDHRRKRIDPKDLVMFISLDTQNIGRIESIVDIKDRNVSINLSAENQSILGYVKENFKELYNSLKENGYKLVDIRYRLLTDAVKPLNVERNIKKGMEESLNRVDMRI